MLRSEFELLARYNLSMNGRVYMAVEKLSEASMLADKGAFFGSVLGTLNHIMVGDIVWLKRFAASLPDVKALDYVRPLPVPKSLSEMLYNDLQELTKARARLDEVIVTFVSELGAEVWASSIAYLNMKGDSFRKPFSALLLHLFNHQTHHRGQVTTLLNQEGIDIGMTDLLEYIPRA